MNPVEAFLALAGVAFSLMVCGSALTFGIIMTCRWMEWVPIICVTYVNNTVSSAMQGGAK